MELKDLLLSLSKSGVVTNGHTSRPEKILIIIMNVDDKLYDSIITEFHHDSALIQSVIDSGALGCGVGIPGISSSEKSFQD